MSVNHQARFERLVVHGRSLQLASTRPDHPEQGQSDKPERRRFRQRGASRATAATAATWNAVCNEERFKSTRCVVGSRRQSDQVVAKAYVERRRLCLRRLCSVQAKHEARVTSAVLRIGKKLRNKCA